MAEINITSNATYPVYLNSGNDQTANISAVINLAPAGSVIYFPRSTYYVSGSIVSRNATNSQITLRGDDPDATMIALHASNTLANASIVTVQGASSVARWFSMRNLTFNGNNRTPLQPLIYFKNAANIRLEHVFIEQTMGMGLHAQQWTDSVCHDLQFGSVGTPTTPQMLVESNGPDNTTASKNLIL
jgi:hypothetical protein